MKEIVLTKAAGGVLVPCDPQAAEFISKMKIGAGVRATVTQQRNVKFHRKLFALFNLAFDHWEPAEATYKGQIVAKNFELFRGNITVLAGYYEMAVDLRGDVRLTPKSISFASMSQDEFDSLYSSVVSVVLARILTNYTQDQLDAVMDQLLGFL